MKISKLIFLFVVCSLLACQKPAYVPENEGEAEERSVSFSINSTGSQTDLVAIQIFSYDSNNAKRVYAYGLFDSYSIPSITLVNDQTYSFSVTSVEDGQSVIASENNGYGVEYYAPFSLKLSDPLLVENKFNVSTMYLQFISSGMAILAYGNQMKSYLRPQIKRYAGYSGRVELGEKNEISLELRKVFGAIRLSATDMHEGRLIFSFDGSEDVVLTPDNTEQTIYMSLSGSPVDETLWTKDDYSETVSYSVTYIDSKNQRYLLGDNLKLELVRAKTQPIEAMVHSKADVAITLESGELEELTSIVLEME